MDRRISQTNLAYQNMLSDKVCTQLNGLASFLPNTVQFTMINIHFKPKFPVNFPVQHQLPSCQSISIQTGVFASFKFLVVLKVFVHLVLMPIQLLVSCGFFPVEKSQFSLQNLADSNSSFLKTLLNDKYTMCSCRKPKLYLKEICY